MIIVIVDSITPRLAYTAKQIFNYFLKVDYKLVEANSEKHEGFLINYSSNNSVIADLRIVPHGLLSENSCELVLPTVSVIGNDVKLFLNDTPHFGFDLFSAIFWTISRYEEYFDHKVDAHNRFEATTSIAFKNGYLKLPVVDFWMLALRNLIEKKVSGLIPVSEFSVTNTIDVDNAYAYKGKEMVRRLGAFSRDLFKGKLAENKKRMSVLRGHEKDPFDTYDYIREQTASNNIQTIFFHLVGEKSKHDRNIRVNSATYIKLLNELSTWSQQGLHPSYASNTEPLKLKQEKSWLESSLGKSIKNSRQHFLMLQFPYTYNSLIDAGITDDFTMGYADQIGFRAGTANCFTFFDVKSNCEKPLTIHPFCVMDGTLHDYLKLNVDDALLEIKKMIELHKHLGLPYRAVWHNETLSNTNEWEGWRKVFEAQFL